MSQARVLVVDDSALLTQVLTDALGAAGFEVSTAVDGSDALRQISSSRPDLIVADILMPVMDGWALCEEVRRTAATSDIPFIFLTTERDVPKRIKGLEIGADDYVCKPFSKEELVARAKRVLRRSRDVSSAQTAASWASSTPRDGGPPDRTRMSGHTDHIAMADLLQLLSLNRKSGTLHLWGESVGRIYFQDGQIINAETQRLKGEKALFRIMAWPSISFEFEAGPLARQIEPALSGSTPSVLMAGFAHLDELRDMMADLPARGPKLRVPIDKAPQLETMELDTIQRIILLTAGGRGATMAEIIDSVPQKDLDAYAAVNDLLRSGLLEVFEESPASPGR